MTAKILVSFVPVMDRDESDIREILMPPALHDWLYQSDRKKTANFKPNVRAFLGEFVKGKREIDNEDYMKSWQDDVFELRCQILPRRERIRIFGAVARPDTFVAFFWKLRSDFGPAGDPAWSAAIARAVSQWDTYFPGERRLPARPFSGCLVANWYDVHTGERG